MEKKVIELIGVFFRIFLRHWASDNKISSQNIIDIEQFAQQCGLSIWDAKKFNRTIDDYIDTMAEDFIDEFGVLICEDGMKELVLNQIHEDVGNVGFTEEKLIFSLSNQDELYNAIISKSQKERIQWGEAENELYLNCVKFISKAGMDFVSKLPTFTPEVLKVVLTRQEEYHKELYDILQGIREMTKLIKNTEITYREYESIYREKLIEKYSKVELIGSGLKDRNLRKYDISSSYVELTCINDEKYDNEIKLSQVFNNDNVVWIKGEAGSGKTTFLHWVAVCAAKNDYKKIKNINNTIPIVIELRNIDWPINLYDIVNKLTMTSGKFCPDGWILELLNNNRAVLLFDGLDEISPLRRDEVYEFVEDIMKRNNSNKILLTARNSVKDNIVHKSSTYEIMPMQIRNVKKFITYWHRSVLRQDAIINDEEIKRLQHNLVCKIVESQSLKSLARNPLLCAMICALNYVNNEQLPDDKMELYDKCCEMLMDARDKQRNIDINIYNNIPTVEYSRKRKILEELAFWMMNGGVSSESRKNVIEFLTHLFKDTNILSDSNRGYNIEQILDYLVERSGIIREPEQGTIDFIHKTFMEYLAVKSICRNCEWNVLVKEACNNNWKETIIMCFHEMGKDNVEDVLKKLIVQGELKDDNRYVLIASLGASNAIFLPDSDVKKEIDIQISKLIPPQIDEVFEIAQAGSYIIPFLKNKESYSTSDKMKCLTVLDYIETEEIIPCVLSYIIDNDNISAKAFAVDILRHFTEDILDDYNVREELMDSVKKSIYEGRLFVYEGILSLLNNMQFNTYEVEIFSNVRDLEILCGVDSEDMYYETGDILKLFSNCKKVRLIGDVQSICFLNDFLEMEELTLEFTDEFMECVNELSCIKNLCKIKKLYIYANVMSYFCINDLINMNSLETFEFYCHDEELEFDVDTFDDLPNLKNIILDVHEFVLDEIRWRIPNWQKYRSDLNIITRSSDKKIYQED